MAADFPASPAVNDTYTLGSYTWKWTGTVWDSVSTATVASSAVTTFLTTPTSANLASAVTDETGTGLLVFQTDPILKFARLWSPKEITTVDAATGITGTINFSMYSQGTKIYTANAAGNFVINVRGDVSTTLNTALATGDGFSFIQIHQNGTTPYYMTSMTIDGSAQTIKWVNGTAPAAGNASSLDAYAFTIIKTAATPTYLVFGNMTKYA
jgi:hypothetical protein